LPGFSGCLKVTVAVCASLSSATAPAIAFFLPAGVMLAEVKLSSAALSVSALVALFTSISMLASAANLRLAASGTTLIR
jgi:hypothetical protein